MNVKNIIRSTVQDGAVSATGVHYVAAKNKLSKIRF